MLIIFLNDLDRQGIDLKQQKAGPFSERIDLIYKITLIVDSNQSGYQYLQQQLRIYMIRSIMSFESSR